jgi:Asp-tRNA(Asn)/Glu-tRNA(Gln) amidotransferase A subunit family amidase
MVPLAIGSDGGGSIRIPASLCGVVGFKATFGLVPREPQWPGWYSLTHLGPLAFTVADCALMTAVMAGPDSLDPTSLPPLADDLAAAGRATGDLSGLRIAYSEDLGYLRVDPGVRAAFRDAVERFRSLGAEMVEDDPGLPNPIDTWNTIACIDNLVSEGPLLATGRIGDDTRELIEAGRPYSGADYVRARNEQGAYSTAFGRFMERYDLFLTPAMEVVAFQHGTTGPPAIEGQPIGDHFDDWCHFCYPANLTGAPAISVPMGAAEEGMPVGLQLTGRRLEDATVLRAAAAWERIAPWPRPPLASSEDAAEVEADTPREQLRAGMRLRGADGVTTVLRAYSPADGELVVETEPPA